ncbi:hypothetical protein [Paludisphaera soli]|uniref:hypothetical protein n=1 Tax=Paludisphaera soli TaxID=2712865 RepID=UPI0013ECA1A1|nr:hypothetical protein [Paludisphaera soli]
MDAEGPPNDVTRPRDEDLAGVVRRFLARLAEDPFLVLRVSDEGTGGYVEVLNHDLRHDERDEEQGIVFAVDGVPVVRTPTWDLEMSFLWPVEPEPEPVAAFAPVARRLGFPPPRVRRGDVVLMHESYPTVPRAWRSVQGLDAEAIARLCLDVLRDVFGRGPSHRLRASVGYE